MIQATKIDFLNFCAIDPYKVSNANDATFKTKKKSPV